MWTGQPRDDQTPSSHSWQGISLQSKIPTPNRLYKQWADQCGDAILKCITPAMQHLFIGQNPHPKETGQCTDQCEQDAQEMILRFLICHSTSL